MEVVEEAANTHQEVFGFDQDRRMVTAAAWRLVFEVIMSGRSLRVFFVTLGLRMLAMLLR